MHAPMRSEGTRAVVVGGSVAGIFAAAVAAPLFDEVQARGSAVHPLAAKKLCFYEGYTHCTCQTPRWLAGYAMRR